LKTSPDRSRPPAAGAAQTTRFPPCERYSLGNGMQVLAAPMPHVPLVTLALVAPAGGEHDPAGRAGLATLVAGLLDEGTRNRSSEDIARHIEGLGGALSTSADWDAAYLQVEVLTPQCGEALALLGELAIEATLPESELERLRRRRLADLLRRRADPSALADRYFARALYGEGTYGWPLVGDEAAATAITRDDCIGFQARHFTPNASFLVAVGHFEPDRLRQEAASVFLSWQGTPQLAPRAPSPLERDGLTVQVVDHAGAAQTELRIGHVGVPKRHPDRATLVVLNAILGGKFTSRINLNLREKHGWTYGATSRFADRRGAGPFVVSAAVVTDKAGEATREVLTELERLRQEPVSETELADAKSFLVGVFPYQLQSNDGVAGKLEELALHGLPDDHYERFLVAIGEVTAEDVLQAARRHVRPENAQVVAVGPGSELGTQFVAAETSAHTVG
jgi:zinc protease